MAATQLDHEPLRILLVEDTVDDAELIGRALRALGRPLDIRRVASEATLRAALAEFQPELILSDFSMPGFGGHFALKLARELASDVPFLFVSGTIGEETAIDALQRGADDYVLKDNLRRLPSAIERALRNAEERRARHSAERALRASEERFRSIVEATDDWIWETDLEGRLSYSNRSIEQILGHSLQTLLGQPVAELMMEDERGAIETALPGLIAAGKGWNGRTTRWRHRDGSARVLESNASPLFDEQRRVIGYRGVDRDVTQRVQQRQKIQQLARIHAVLSALGSAVLRSAESQQVLDQACRIAVEQGGFASAWVAVRDADRGVSRAAHHGAPGAIDPIDEERGRVLFGGPVAEVLRSGTYTSVPSVAAAALPQRLRQAAALAGIRAFIALPLGSKPWGVLSLYSNRPHDFDEDEVALLERLAADIDFALDFIAKSERLEYLAYHSPLTGMPNRLGFRDMLTERMRLGPQLVGIVDVVPSTTSTIRAAAISAITCCARSARGCSGCSATMRWSPIRARTNSCSRWPAPTATPHSAGSRRCCAASRRSRS
jgi:PAS domain S-box-containing protein